MAKYAHAVIAALDVLVAAKTKLDETQAQHKQTKAALRQLNETLELDGIAFDAALDVAVELLGTERAISYCGLVIIPSSTGDVARVEKPIAVEAQ